MENVFFCGECRKFFFGMYDESDSCICKYCGSEVTVNCNLSKKEYDSYSPSAKDSFKSRIKLMYPSAESIIAFREREVEQLRRNRAMAQMLVTSGFNFDGYRIVKYSGYISGDDAMTVSRGSSFTDGGVRDKLMSSLTQIRRNALRELKEAAYDLGCNAVIGVDFDYITLDPQTANISGGTTYQPYVFCVTANGNAVIIEKIED
jgi:uncharacterized protein YbjQ (UPF0145 family)